MVHLLGTSLSELRAEKTPARLTHPAHFSRRLAASLTSSAPRDTDRRSGAGTGRGDSARPQLLPDLRPTTVLRPSSRSRSGSDRRRGKPGTPWPTRHDEARAPGCNLALGLRRAE